MSISDYSCWLHTIYQSYPYDQYIEAPTNIVFSGGHRPDCMYLISNFSICFWANDYFQLLLVIFTLYPMDSRPSSSLHAQKISRQAWLKPGLNLTKLTPRLNHSYHGWTNIITNTTTTATSNLIIITIFTIITINHNNKTNLLLY